MTSVFEYFRDQLHREPADETLRELPLESPCGRDCKQAIDEAALQLRKPEPDTDAIVRNASDQVEIFWRG